MISVLQMSLAAAPLICGIALARTLLRRRIPSLVFLVLWNLAVCRLLALLWVPVCGVAVKPLLNHVYGGIFNVTLETVTLLDDRLLLFIWIVGALTVLGITLKQHFKRRASWREASFMPQETVLRWQAAQTGPRPIDVRWSQTASGPFSRGVLHPVIIFPDKMMGEPEEVLLPILAHEEAHLRGFHPLMRYALLAVCCIHWFNPFVWLLLMLFEKDMELTADEKAMRGKTHEEKVRYANLLNKMDKERRKQRMALSATPHLGEPSLIERMQMLKFPKKQSKVGAVAVVVTVGIIFGLLTTVPYSGVRRDLQPRQHLNEGESIEEYFQRMDGVKFVLWEDMNGIFKKV